MVMWISSELHDIKISGVIRLRDKRIFLSEFKILIRI